MGPDEKRLERLIGAAFERLPEPEAARLNALEARLTRRAARAPRRSESRLRYWWLIAALAATGAAAWWAGGYFDDAFREKESRRDVPAVTGQTGDGKAAGQMRERQEGSPSADGAGTTQESPTIYRREMY